MTTSDMIRSMLSYHETAMLRTWDSVQTLVTDDEFLLDISFSCGSLRNELIHVASVDRRWLSGIAGIAKAEHARFDNYADKSAARAFSDQVLESIAEYVEKLTDKALAEVPEGMPVTRWQVLMHMVNHGTDHRGRILSMFKRLGKPVFDQDYFYYLTGKL